MSDRDPAEIPEKTGTADCAVHLDIDPDNERAESLKKIADALMADHNISQSGAIIEAAICVFEEVLALRPVGHERRVDAMGDLGNTLFWFCFHNEASPSRRARCFELLREALQLCPPGHPARDRALHNLARALRFVDYQQQSGGLDNLEESILLNRAALQLRPVGHPERANSLSNLADGLVRSFHHGGDLESLAEAIIMHREGLELRPHGHPLREVSLHNLGTVLKISFQHQGGSATFAEALSVSRESLQLQPVGHPSRWMTLSALGNSLALGFATTGLPELLTESIRLHREALQLMHSSHPGRALALSNFAHGLLASFRHTHDRSVLAESITLLRQCLRLPLGQYERFGTLNTLAEALVASFDENERLADMQEALSLHREVLESLQLGPYRRVLSLQGLGRLLCRSECQSWTEALAVFREAMDISPAGSPIRAEVLSDVSRCFLDPESPFFDLDQGVLHLSQAYSDNCCHVNQRLQMALSDLSRVETAYAKTSLNLSSLEHCNNCLLDLYAQVIGLLPRAANFGLDYSTRLQAVAGLDEISRNAAARAILLGDEPQALGMLEEGRGVFWSQALHLRTNALDDVPKEEREQLQRLLRLLEYSARRVEGADETAGQRERDLERRRQLNEEAEALILKIRGYAGLDRFLLPPTFDSLVGALPKGFVVVVNASKLGYHALLVNGDRRLVTSLTLQPPPTGLDSATIQSHLPRDLSSEPHGISTRAMRKVDGRGGSILDVLAVLWTAIVGPVIRELGLQKAYGRNRPRLWWCVTGELSFLPVHAAGNYRGTSPLCAADYVSSSYVPTLSSLTKARAGWKPIERTGLAGLLVCEESSNCERAKYLPKVVEEVHIVRTCSASAKAQVLNAPSEHTSLSDLRSLLENTPAQILHLACHGIHDSDPLKSALVLQDGNLTIQDIMSFHLPNAALAVLSACQTAKGNRNAPDQAIHLAASMLFCGFRSVIGTMWLMHDDDGPRFAQAVYEALFRSETFDLDDVPYALDEAVAALRTAGVPAERWALFMHMGG